MAVDEGEEETVVTIIGEAMEVHVTTMAVGVTTMTVDRSMEEEEEEIVAAMTVVEVKSLWDLMFRLLLIGYAVTATKFLGNLMLHGTTIWQFFNLVRL